MLSIHLKRLRENKGLTRKEVAEYLKIDQSTYGKYELGKREPDLPTVAKLANFFNVSADYLLYGFNKTELTSLVNVTRYQRSIKEFSDDTGIDEHYLNRLCSGAEYEQPSIDIIIKIASNNKNGWLADTKSLFKAAGYDLEEISSDLLEGIPLELLKHYKEQDMTESEMIIAYIDFKNAKKEDALGEFKDDNNHHELISSYNQLTDAGKDFILETINRLKELDIKQKPGRTNRDKNHYLLPDAAHEIEGATEEDKAHDDVIMDDDDF